MIKIIERSYVGFLDNRDRRVLTIDLLSFFFFFESNFTYGKKKIIIIIPNRDRNGIEPDSERQTTKGYALCYEFRER